ncbi:MAG TPA: hypothetical protein V6D33_04755 [Cyanophyceae cyanobacterium]
MSISFHVTTICTRGAALTGIFFGSRLIVHQQWVTRSRFFGCAIATLELFYNPEKIVRKKYEQKIKSL